MWEAVAIGAGMYLAFGVVWATIIYVVTWVDGDPKLSWAVWQGVIWPLGWLNLFGRG